VTRAVEREARPEGSIFMMRLAFAIAIVGQEQLTRKALPPGSSIPDSFPKDS
jgi:hypothetical protein